MPPPQPVPRITPNTTRQPAPAPSAASLSAKQLASFSTRTSRPSSAAMSRSSALPFSTVELAFFTSPVAGLMVPGMPMPTVQVSPSSRSTSRDQPGHRREGRGIAVGRGDPPAHAEAAVRRQCGDLDLGAAEVDADSVTNHPASVMPGARRLK